MKSSYVLPRAGEQLGVGGMALSGNLGPNQCLGGRRASERALSGGHDIQQQRHLIHAR
jgi:hypothetical protein